MAIINFASREISCKVVYLGPEGAGANANVRVLHGILSEGPGKTGDLHRFVASDHSDASWYLEHTPEHLDIEGFRLRIRIWSLPGGLVDAEHRSVVTDDIDGAVFVADRRPAASASNGAALLDLEQVLADQERDLPGFPLVLQLNHGDADDALPAHEVERPLNAFGFPVVQSSVKPRHGLEETFASLRDALQAALQAALSGQSAAIRLTALHDPAGNGGLDLDPLTAIRATPAPVGTVEGRTDYQEPTAEISVAFLTRELAGSRPVRIMDSQIEDGQLYVDLELERMSGGTPATLRVRMLNRPADADLVPSSPGYQSPVPDKSSVVGVTDHLPDKISFDEPLPESSDSTGIWLGVTGLAGGLFIGLLMGFLLFN